MKDYTQNDFESTTFILSFDVVEDTIVIYYANGNIEYVENTPKRKKQLLEIMQNQVINYQSKQTILKECYKMCTKSKYINYSILIASLAFIAKNNNSILLSLLAMTSSISWLSNIDFCKEIESLIEDYDKNKFYVDNKDIFDNATYSEITNGLNKNIIEYINNNDNKLDINIIDNMDYKELKLIYNNIKRK